MCKFREDGIFFSLCGAGSLPRHSTHGERPRSQERQGWRRPPPPQQWVLVSVKPTDPPDQHTWSFSPEMPLAAADRGPTPADCFLALDVPPVCSGHGPGTFSSPRCISSVRAQAPLRLGSGLIGFSISSTCHSTCPEEALSRDSGSGWGSRRVDP